MTETLADGSTWTLGYLKRTGMQVGPAPITVTIDRYGKTLTLVASYDASKSQAKLVKDLRRCEHWFEIPLVIEADNWIA